MSYQYFLKVDGILGEATAVTHKDEIEIMSFSWGVSNASTPSATGGRAGTPQFSDLALAGSFGKAGPKLMHACASGQNIKTATLSGMLSAGSAKPVDALRIVFTDVLISQFNLAGSSGDLPGESVSIAYGKVQVQYLSVNAKGAVGAPVTAGWDLRRNVAA